MAALDYLARTDTVRIATDLRAGGEVVTPIWAVVVDGKPNIRSGYGAESKWYRRARRTGRLTFVDGRHRYPGVVVEVTDEATLAAVDAAYLAKYRGQSGATEAASAPTRDNTLRVDLD